MSSDEIKIGHRAVYVGSPPGQGWPHTVIDRTGPVVTTWSDYTDVEEEGGFSWRGPVQKFVTEFRPIGPCAVE